MYPTCRIGGESFQHVFISQLPDKPWQLHTLLVFCFINWNKRNKLVMRTRKCDFFGRNFMIWHSTHVWVSPLCDRRYEYIHSWIRDYENTSRIINTPASRKYIGVLIAMTSYRTGKRWCRQNLMLLGVFQEAIRGGYRCLCHTTTASVTSRSITPPLPLLPTHTLVIRCF